MAVIPSLDDNTLRAICDVIGDTSVGLTGSEIGRLLAQQGIADIEPMITKRHRLFSALQSKQKKDRCANNILAFVQIVMDPVRYSGAPESFEQRRDGLNVILALRGFELKQDGKIAKVDQVHTLTEAQKKANHLHAKLTERRVHHEVLRFCQAELVADNYFHAVFEATKSVADRIRTLSGLTSDGADLIDKAFSTNSPILAINTLITETEQSEQTGFGMLLKGIFGTFRNVTAHAPKIKWQMPEDDALDLLTMVSFAHRKLDKTFITGIKQ
jgi:uncharacterized protein (TIGR02391 family)